MSEVRQKDLPLRVWVNSPDSVASEQLLAALMQKDSRWEVTNTPDKANLWCVEHSVVNYDKAINLFNRMGTQKPRVIVLAENFINTPNKRWIFFKTPINTRILNTWLQVNFPNNHGNENASLPIELQKSHLKLQFWPNMSLYPDDNAVVMVCSMLLHNWCTREELLVQDIEASLLDQILIDAYNENNLLHRKELAVEKKDFKIGLFKRLINKFSGK